MAILNRARDAGIGVVAGTMVGETAVLDAASELLLAHRDELSYVEGLGQSRQILEASPVIRVSGTDATLPVFQFEADPKFLLGNARWYELCMEDVG